MFFPQKTRAAIAAAVLSALLAPGVGAAKKPKEPKPVKPRGARIDGQVLRDPKRTPVAGAIVRVKFFDGGEEWVSPPTDRKGRFRLDALPYGYAELVVESPDGKFPCDHVVELPPLGTVGLTLGLRPMAPLPSAWWSGEATADAKGVALGKQNLRGRDFWTSPAGIGIIAGTGAAVLLAIASGSKTRGN